MNHKFEYIVEDDGGIYPDDAVEFIHQWTIYGVDGFVAETAGEHYGAETDSECQWPRVFAIYRDGELQGRFSVDQEYEPSYHSRKLPTFPRMSPWLSKEWAKYFDSIGRLERIRKANPSMSDARAKELTEVTAITASEAIHNLVFP